MSKYVVSLIIVLILIVGWVVLRSDDIQDDLGLGNDHVCLADSILQDEFDHYSQTVIEAREISGTDLAPVNILDDWSVNGEEVLWWDSTGTIYVDEELFGDLEKHHATGLGEPEDEVVIGSATQALLASVEPREIVEALLRTQVIELYAHLYGSACLVAEETVGDVYTVTYEGNHSYCTNECVDDDFAFSVSVDTSTGEIRLMPD